MPSRLPARRVCRRSRGKFGAQPTASEEQPLRHGPRERRDAYGDRQAERDGHEQCDDRETADGFAVDQPQHFDLEAVLRGRHVSLRNEMFALTVARVLRPLRVASPPRAHEEGPNARQSLRKFASLLS